MDTLKLNVTTDMADAKTVRQSGMIPMVYYGGKAKNKHFAADYQDFRRVYEKGGRSTIIYINDGKEEFPVLVQEIQFDPVKDDIMHVDLYAVNMNKPITTEVPLVFVGTSPAVKEMGGTLMHSREYLNIECLPKNLVHEIEVDISSLEDFNSRISIGDLQIPEGITVLDEDVLTVATVSAPRTEEELEALEEEPEAPEIEGEEGEEAEEGEGEEGGEAEGEEGESGDEEKAE